MNCATSCINVAVGGHDCFTNRHLVLSDVNTFNLDQFKILLFGRELKVHFGVDYQFL